MVAHTLRQRVKLGFRVIQGFCSPTSYTVANSAKQRIEPGIQPRQRRRLAQVAQHAVRAAKAREHHRVDALPWKGAVAHAVQPLARPRAQDLAKQLGFLQVVPPRSTAPGTSERPRVSDAAASAEVRLIMAHKVRSSMLSRDLDHTIIEVVLGTWAPDAH